MNRTLIIAGGIAIIAGCVSLTTLPSSAQLDGSSDGVTKTYDVASFTGLDVAAGVEVNFTTGGAQSVVAENENGAWDKLEVRVRGDELEIQRKYEGWGWNRKKEKFKVTVSAPAIERVEASSGSYVTGSGVSGDDVIIDTSSGASIKIKDIRAQDMTVNTSSGSTTVLSGTCAALEADTSSGSSLRAKDLVCQTATLESSSGSSLSVTATASVNADASSGSSINVSGNPAQSEIDKSSGASVNIRS